MKKENGLTQQKCTIGKRNEKDAKGSLGEKYELRDSNV